MTPRRLSIVMLSWLAVARRPAVLAGKREEAERTFEGTRLTPPGHQAAGEVMQAGAAIL